MDNHSQTVIGLRRLSHKVDLRLAPAIETLDSLLAEGLAGSIDFIFSIDTIREIPDGYYERSLKLLRPGGLIAVDNVLWSGRVLNGRNSVNGCHCNQGIQCETSCQDNSRIFLSMAPIADGSAPAAPAPWVIFESLQRRDAVWVMLL